MKTKVKYKDYGDFPDMNTVRDIVVYGAERGGDKKQFKFENLDGKKEVKTFNETYRDVIGMYMYFRKLGLTGKKIALLSENSYYWIAIFYAVSMGNFIMIPMDSKLTDPELVDIAVRSRCDAICYSPDYASTAELMRANEDVCITEYIPIADFYDHVRDGYGELADSDGIPCPDEKIDPDALAYIVYTSGTTGKSKGVMLSQANVATDSTATLRAMTAGQTVSFLPFNHTFSWASSIIAGHLLSVYVYISKSIKHLQKDFSEQHPQHFTAVPLAVETVNKRIWATAKKNGRTAALLNGLKLSRFLMKFGIDLRHRLFKEVIDSLGGNLEMIICGGAHLDEKYERELYDMGIQVIVGYGITECSPVVTCNRLNDFKFGSVGKALECNEIKIKDPDADGIGEVCVRGTNVMLGYYDDPEATEEAFDGEWYKTGDYGYIDSDGFLFLKGRKKNLIVLSNGKNVSPEELEEKLKQIDYVKEVLVYDEDDVITAEFYLEPDAENADRLREDVNAVNRELPTYKRIGNIKTRSTEFPKTTTMKIKRQYS